MSPPREQTPSKPSRRSKRLSRKSTGVPSTPVSSSQDADVSAQTPSNQQPIQPTRILRRGDPGALLEVNLLTDSDSVSPHTPPRPRSMYEGSASALQDSDGVSSPAIHNNRKTPKPRNRKQPNTESPKPSAHGTPATAPRRGSATPNMSNATPVKAYAGPTFHASPAASALPMPKFFSKSVPNIDKTKSLKTMLEQETPESSSGSEVSPSLDHIQPSLDVKTREESPLDVFFHADRQSKIRSESNPNFSGDAKSHPSPSDLPSRIRPSPLQSQRNSSSGSIFPLEMDGASPDMSSESAYPSRLPNATIQASSIKQPSPVPLQIDPEEQRKAQTAALKKLLFSQRPQSFHDGSVSQRPPSSKLRKEILASTSPIRESTPPELPASPTPSRAPKPPMNPMTGRNAQLDNYASPSPPVDPSSQLQHASDSIYDHETANARSIENDLRRILKLDAIGCDGLTGH